MRCGMRMERCCARRTRQTWTDLERQVRQRSWRGAVHETPWPCAAVKQQCLCTEAAGSIRPVSQRLVRDHTAAPPALKQPAAAAAAAAAGWRRGAGDPRGLLGIGSVAGARRGRPSAAGVPPHQHSFELRLWRLASRQQRAAGASADHCRAE